MSERFFANPHKGNGLYDYAIDLSYKGLRPGEECESCSPVTMADIDLLASLSPEIAELVEIMNQNIEIYEIIQPLLNSSQSGNVVDINDIERLHQIYRESPENFYLGKVIEEIKGKNSLIHSRMDRQNNIKAQITKPK